MLMPSTVVTIQICTPFGMSLNRNGQCTGQVYYVYVPVLSVTHLWVSICMCMHTSLMIFLGY